MPTPLHLKPPTAAWIVRERKRLGLKPRDVAARLVAMGRTVTEDTVKVWESNANRRPAPENLDSLEQLFGSKAPDRDQPPAGMDLSPIIDALRAQTEAMTALVDELRLTRLQQAAATEEVMRGIAASIGGPAPRGRRGATANEDRVGTPR